MDEKPQSSSLYRSLALLSLAMHYFLLAIAAVTLGGVGVAIKQFSILAVSGQTFSVHTVGLYVGITVI